MTLSPLKSARSSLLVLTAPKFRRRLASLLARIQPAGVILFARNITSAEQTHKLLKDCQACVSTPLFTCVDMEGGRVDRFRNLNGGSPSAADVFATEDRKLFRKHGGVIGGFCRALGFNTDFAPVLDLAFEASRSVMSSRAVSADPQETAIYAKEFLAGLRDAGVLGCGKHFPGLGEGNLDSHHQLPVIEKSLRNFGQRTSFPTGFCAARCRLCSFRMQDIPPSLAITRRPRSQKSGSQIFCGSA